MASVTITCRQVRQDRLPDVCARCGAPSTFIKDKSFSWCPPWVGVLILVGLLPWLIVWIILTKRMTVPVPLCDRHKGHWSWRTWFTVLSLLALIAGSIGTVILWANLKQGGRADDVVGFVCMGSVGLFIVWIIVVAVLQMTAIRPLEITDDFIRLTGVSPDFRDAVDDEYDQYREERSSRRRARYEDEEDDEDDRPRGRGDRYWR